MSVIYVATTNAGKLREFRSAAAGRFSLEPLPDLKNIPAPEETGLSFKENAVLKARYYGQFTQGWLFAEDSGLEVDGLGGAPGVHSARFSGPDATDESNNILLLERLAGAKDRSARYVCVIALMEHGELVHTFRGTVEGAIAHAPAGSGGFGYDPLFFYPPFGCTFGEVPLERKQQVSHRAAAVSQLATWFSSQRVGQR